MTSPYRVIPLTKGYVAIVSAEDYRRVNKYEWHVHVSKGTKKKPGKPYARATINGKKVYLHRFVMNTPEWMQADHLNHQTLDCRRENLENVEHVENQRRRRNALKRTDVAIVNDVLRTVGSAHTIPSVDAPLTPVA